MGYTCQICNKPARIQTPTGRWICMDCYRDQFNNIKEKVAKTTEKPVEKTKAEPKIEKQINDEEKPLEENQDIE